MDSMFVRNSYLKKVEPYIGKEIIKVLTGQRRVGKDRHSHALRRESAATNFRKDYLPKLTVNY